MGQFFTLKSRDAYLFEITFLRVFFREIAVTTNILETVPRTNRTWNEVLAATVEPVCKRYKVFLIKAAL